jgi:hypothetical protein
MVLTILDGCRTHGRPLRLWILILTERMRLRQANAFSSELMTAMTTSALRNRPRQLVEAGLRPAAVGGRRLANDVFSLPVALGCMLHDTCINDNRTEWTAILYLININPEGAGKCPCHTVYPLVLEKVSSVDMYAKSAMHIKTSPLLTCLSKYALCGHTRPCLRHLSRQPCLRLPVLWTITCPRQVCYIMYKKQNLT